MIVPCKSALQCALRRPSIIRTPYHASKLPDATKSMTLGLSSVASTRPGDVSVAKLCSVRMPGNAVRTCHAPSARERDLDMRVPLEGEEVKLVQGKIGSCHLSALCSVTSPWPTHPMALEEAFEQGLLGVGLVVSTWHICAVASTRSSTRAQMGDTDEMFRDPRTPRQQLNENEAMWARKWDTYLAAERRRNNGRLRLRRDRKLKELVRHGIPNSARPEVRAPLLAASALDA